MGPALDKNVIFTLGIMKLTSVNESSIFLYLRSKAYLFEEDAKLINIGLSLTFVSPIFSDIKLETQGGKLNNRE